MSPSNNINNNNANSLSDVTTGCCEASKLHRYNNGTTLSKKELSAGDVTNSYGLTFQGIAGGSGMAKTNIPRSTSWYDGFFGCLKPVWSLMGKNKPSNLQNTNEGRIAIIQNMIRL